MYVGMYVCEMITFESLDVGSSLLHLFRGNTDWFIYEGRWVKVNVTGAKKIFKNPYYHNVKL